MAYVTKFTPDRVKRILDDIGDHIPYKIAAESNGVADSTFYYWLSKGLEHLLDGKDTEYTRMLEALRSIEKNRIKECLQNIKYSEKGHYGMQWVLERSFWKYFSSKASEIEIDQRLAALEAKQLGAQSHGSEAEQLGSEKTQSETESEST